MPAAARDEVSLRGRPLHDLERHGQVVWISYLRRNLLTADHLPRLIREYAISGIGFDAELFAHAVAGGPEYADQVAHLRERGRSSEEILEELLIEDVCLAARAVRDARPGELGGWVAVGVPPRHRASVEAITGWTRTLEEATGSSRILVKLPASATGLRAVEGVLAAGHSVYVDQIFGLEQLERSLEAYGRGLGLRLARGGDFSTARLVAAMNLVRIDVAVDEALRRRRRETEGERDMIESLHGRAAIALGKLAWRRLREADRDPAWGEFAAKGAHPAWLAWEGTRTLSPARRDVEYLEELIGPRTISVVSRLALGAFRDHGETAPTVARQHDEATEIVEDLRAVGVDLDAVATELQEAALRLRESRGERLLAAVERESDRTVAVLEPGVLEPACDELLEKADRMGLVHRLWERDPTLWPAGVGDPARIRDRLGWLALPEAMSEEALPLLANRPGSERSPLNVILVGMGGSSLGAEACRIAFGRRRFVVLDTTVPRGVAAVAAGSDTGESIFIVSSKSGSTIETLALADFFWEREDEQGSGERWVAITDPGTPLHELARGRSFQRIWLNPPDVGGRYSVLSYFGLVPMALMDVDVGRILESASRMAVQSGAEVAAADNPAVRLALMLAAGLTGGRNKLTLLTSKRLAGLADWIEQLVAESTGKDGRGIVPVSQEPLGVRAAYADDRMFVQIRLADDPADEAQVALLGELRAEGVPVARYELEDPHDLGAEFLRWELAVAMVGALIGFDPFDEPDVRGAKRRTAELLATTDGDEESPAPVAIASTKQLEVFGDPERLGLGADETDVDSVLATLLGSAEPPEYVAIQAFLAPDLDTWHALQGLRALLRDRRRVVATVGWGPRFLHSTGQLHKGGVRQGRFLQLTAEAEGDLAIPGRDYTFGQLAAAQALADYRALAAGGRSAVRVHFRGASDAGLASLLETVRRVLD